MNLNKELRIVMLGLVLAVICGLCAAAMAYAVAVTEKPIADAKAKRLTDGFRLILPGFDNDIAKTAKKIKLDSGDEVEVFTATKKNKVLGYAVRASAQGYGGNVEGLIGLTPDGVIQSYIITGHNETPGLGSQATDRVRKKTIFDLFRPKKTEKGLAPNRILDSFIGKSAKGSANPWTVKKDGGNVDAVSGATISSRAVTKIAWNAACSFQKINAGKGK